MTDLFVPSAGMYLPPEAAAATTQAKGFWTESGQTITNNVDTTIGWDTVNAVDDPDSWFTMTAGSLDVAQAGYIYIIASIGWAGNTTGIRRIWIEQNGTELAGERDTAAVSSVDKFAAMGVPVVSGDDFTIHCLQNSGGDLAIGFNKTRLAVLFLK